jgi:hypothetical protein
MDVRFGAKPDITADWLDVRFTALCQKRTLELSRQTSA